MISRTPLKQNRKEEKQMSTLNGKSNRLKYKNNLEYLLFILPGLASMILFHYIPVFGMVLAFKEYNYRDGIFGSPWVGFKNFKNFFDSGDMVRVIRNTVGYNIAWMLLVNLMLGMIVAILLYDVKSKRANKLYQTAMLIPNFLSWVVVAYVGYVILSPTNGILVLALKGMGINAVNLYSSREAAKYWPYILTFFEIWKDVGMASLYYYAALLSIDTSLYEAAALDGAGKFKQMIYVSLPELMPMASMVLILRMGQVLSGGMDIFYQMTLDSGALYSTTETLAVYLYHGLAGKYTVGVTSAVGIFQSAVGLVLLIVTNTIIKKVNPENSVY